MAEEVVKEIRSRLGFLVTVGLDYLALDRPIVLIANPQHARDKEHFDAGAI